MQNNYYFLINCINIILLFLINIETSLAQSIKQSNTQSNGKKVEVLFKPATGNDTPGRSGVAGTRGSNNYNCPNDPSSESKGIVPLTPKNKSQITSLSTAEHPILLVYVPETSAKQIMLTIWEEKGIKVSETFVSITGESGIMPLQPSLNSPSLEDGKKYIWQVQLVCNNNSFLSDPYIRVWVNRVKADTNNINNTESSLEQVSWYGEKGIWYDAVSSFFKITKEEPDNQDLKPIWIEFLNSAQFTKDEVDFWVENIFNKNSDNPSP